MMRRRTTALAAAMLVAVSSLATAQRRGETTSVRPIAPRAGRLGRRGALRQPGVDRQQQQALVQRVREAFAGVVRRQLGLNDDQVQQLQRTEDKYQQQRTQIQRNEGAARRALRVAILDTTNAVDQSKIAGYMQQLVDAQHKRADLLEAEQKDLAAFLTPMQRAKYQGLLEQLQRRISQMRQQGARGRGAPPE